MQPSIWKTNLRGALYAFAAAACFSVVELLIKFVSADYALHQVVFYRAIVSLTAFSLLVLPFAGGGGRRCARAVLRPMRFAEFA